MSTQLYFIYDSHCPWSFATSQLVEQVNSKLPHIQIHFLHAGYYDGSTSADKKTLDSVVELSNAKFGKSYLKTIGDNKDSTLVANLMAWAEQKSPKDSLKILLAMQSAHFNEGNPLATADDVAPILAALKLSPPAKSLKNDKLSKDAEYLMHDIEEIQDIIGTRAIPALLLAHNDDLVLLNHNLYLSAPEKLVEAIELEIE